MEKFHAVISGKFVTAHMGRDGQIKDVRESWTDDCSFWAGKTVTVFPAKGINLASVVLPVVSTGEREEGIYVLATGRHVPKGAAAWVTEDMPLMDARTRYTEAELRKQVEERAASETERIRRKVEMESKLVKTPQEAVDRLLQEGKQRLLVRWACYGKSNGVIDLLLASRWIDSGWHVNRKEEREFRAACGDLIRSMARNGHLQN